MHCCVCITKSVGRDHPSDAIVGFTFIVTCGQRHWRSQGVAVHAIDEMLCSNACRICIENARNVLQPMLVVCEEERSSATILQILSWIRMLSIFRWTLYLRVGFVRIGVVCQTVLSVHVHVQQSCSYFITLSTFLIGMMYFLPVHFCKSPCLLFYENSIYENSCQ